jgi:hypothetical protein
MMNILKWLFGARKPVLNKPVVMRMCLEPKEMNEWQKTDVVINVLNCPFITLTESKMANLWYHEEMDAVFCLTSQGFKVIKGSKKILFDRGLGRHYA